jgi:hypothetical protein
MRALMVMALGSMLFGCRAAGSHAEGSAYGAGIARRAFAPGRPMYTRGQTTGFLTAKPEGTDYRPHAPRTWPPLASSRLPDKEARDQPGGAAFPGR